MARQRADGKSPLSSTHPLSQAAPGLADFVHHCGSNLRPEGALHALVHKDRPLRELAGFATSRARRKAQLLPARRPGNARSPAASRPR